MIKAETHFSDLTVGAYSPYNAIEHGARWDEDTECTGLTEVMLTLVPARHSHCWCLKSRMRT